MALRIGAYAGFFIRVTGNPLIITSRAPEYSDFLFFFIHTPNISLIVCVVKYIPKNILLEVLTKAITCDILFIVIVTELRSVLRWTREKKRDWL